MDDKPSTLYLADDNRKGAEEVVVKKDTTTESLAEKIGEIESMAQAAKQPYHYSMPAVPKPTMMEEIGAEGEPIPTPPLLTNTNPILDTWYIIHKPNKHKVGEPLWVPFMDLSANLPVPASYIEAYEPPPNHPSSYIRFKGGFWPTGLEHYNYSRSWLEPLSTTLHHTTGFGTRTYSLSEIRRVHMSKNLDFFVDLSKDGWINLNAITNGTDDNLEVWRAAIIHILTYATVEGFVDPYDWTPSSGILTKHCAYCPNHIYHYSCTASCICCCNPTRLLQGTFTATLLGKGEDADNIAAIITNAARDEGSKNLSEYLGDKQPLLTSIANVYALQHCVFHGMGLNQTQPALEEAIASLSTNLLNYITMACMGEARHCGLCYNKALDNPIFKAYLKVNVPSRIGTWYSVPYLDALWGRSQTLTYLEDLFAEGGWSAGSYGGHRWANMAHLALLSSTSSITPMIFIDQVINIVHNGGWAFDKYYSREVHCCSHHKMSTSLLKILDIKAKDASTLPLAVCLPSPAGDYLLPKIVTAEEKAVAVVKLTSLRSGRRIPA